MFGEGDGVFVDEEGGGEGLRDDVDVEDEQWVFGEDGGTEMMVVNFEILGVVKLFCICINAIWKKN